jgi:phage portal protein BeeE
MIRRWFARRKARRLFGAGRSAEGVAVLQHAYGKRFMHCLQVMAEDLGKMPFRVTNTRG